MQALDRLLFADLRRMWGQALAISAVLACGIATFVMSSSTMRSLEATRTNYYNKYHFGDIFVQVVRAPHELATRIADIPGVARVQTRVVRDVILDIPGMPEPASCRLVSLPRDPEESLNGVHLRSGRLPDSDKPNEVLVSELFAEANHWSLGDEVHVVMGGRRQKLRIVGVAISPEYVYTVQPGQMLSDDRRFGVMWMPYRPMAAAFNMESAFNDATLTLYPGTSAADVIHRVDRLTERYGGRGAYDRGDQPSDRRVADELYQLQGMALVTPSIFLAVAVFLFNIVLSRMVHQQTGQIATLRAFGYRAREIGWHYVKFILLLVAGGSVVGCACGVLLADWMTGMYVRFFRFPLVHHEFAYDRAALAVLISIIGALAGSGSALRRATRLQPAVAMRPEAPRTSGASLFERIGLQRFLSPMVRMVLRRLERNPISTALSVLGMSLSLAVLILGTFVEDAVDYMIDVQFQRAQRQDVILAFDEHLSAHSLHDVLNLPGVSAAEPFRAVPVRMRHGQLERRLSLMALPEQPDLFRVLDQNETPIDLTGGGVTVSEKLAGLLGLRIGDEVDVELMEGRREKRVLRVAAIFPDYTDPGAYMNLQELHRWLGQGERYSGAFVRGDARRMPELFAELKETPALAGITVKAAAVQNFRDTIAENLRAMRLINAGFSFVIAFGVIYNCALITLAERSRDLATLRVMGFRRREISTVLLGELAVVTLAALPIGLLLGCLFARLSTWALDTETHRIPYVMTNATLAYAAIVMIASACLSSYVVRSMLDRLDLISVLKVQE